MKTTFAVTDINIPNHIPCYFTVLTLFTFLNTAIKCVHTFYVLKTCRKVRVTRYNWKTRKTLVVAKQLVVRAAGL
jgi:hypothetical protein